MPESFVGYKDRDGKPITAAEWTKLAVDELYCTIISKTIKATRIHAAWFGVYSVFECVPTIFVVTVDQIGSPRSFHWCATEQNAVNLYLDFLGILQDKGKIDEGLLNNAA